MDQTPGQLDNGIDIVTPENIAFRYAAAGPFRRLPAYLIDLLIRFGAMIASMILFGLLGSVIQMPDLGMGTALGVWFVIAWFYMGLFELYWNGQTPGKRLLQIRVLSIDGQPIDGIQAVLRNILRAVDGLPFGLYFVGLIAASMNDRYQRMGDLASGTMVVLEEPQWFLGVVRVQEPEAIRMAAQIPAGFRVSRTTARALADYVARRDRFPWIRRMEIARHLGEPLRQRFNMPPSTNYDLLLCALYHRTFVTDRIDDDVLRLGSPFQVKSPFASPAPTT
jgi:uncharacterized RDD family membrane protein YckC